MSSDTPKDFKSMFNPASIQRLGQWVKQLDEAFDEATFAHAALDGLDSMEMKARAAHLRDAILEGSKSSPQALIKALVRGLQDEKTRDGAPMGFELWPLTMLVASHGLSDIDVGFEALVLLTRRFTSEFAVQSFLLHDPARTLERMRSWAVSPNEHDRRLVSEGTRTRLPWGRNMTAFFEAHSQEILGLLELLKDDPAVYVQKSVANHLNDLTRSDPERVLDVLERWNTDAPGGRSWIIRHALRTLLKQGHPRALELLGYTQQLDDVQCEVVDCSDTVRFKESLTWTARISRSEGATGSKNLMVDYELGFASAKGTARKKVFKWRKLTLKPGQCVELEGSFPFKPITTRRYYDGTHTWTLWINGVPQSTYTFELCEVQ